MDKYSSKRFLCRAINGSWYISREVGMMKGSMMNPSKTASVPLTGWMVYDSNIKDFHKDTSVKIKFGELTEDDISGKVRVQLHLEILIAKEIMKSVHWRKTYLQEQAWLHTARLPN